MKDEKLKVIFITQNEPFYIPRYLEKTLSRLGRGVEVMKVYALPPNLPGMNFFQTVRYFFLYYGPVVFAYVVFLRSYYLIKDFLGNIFKINNNFYNVKLVCRKYGTLFSSINDINSKNVLSEIRKLRPDVIFSLASPQIFGNELLSMPLRSCLNIHSSLLPKYRGVNANFWTLLKEEETTGVTIHYMKQKIDAGKILLQKKLKIQKDWSLNDLYWHIIELGSAAIAEGLRILKEGKEAPLENDIPAGSYFSFPSKADVIEFRRKHKRFFKLY